MQCLVRNHLRVCVDMHKYVLLVSFILYVVVTAAPPHVIKQYRTDYVYNHLTDAFYKLHTESRQGWQAMKICETEGSKLLEPTTQDDEAQLLEMLGRFPNLADYVWIGQNETYDLSQEYDLTSTARTPLAWNLTTCHAQDLWMNTVEKNCGERLPFICKVEASAAPYDERCGSYGTNYRHVPSVGSCYKIPRIAYRWYEAYAECRAEGGHLLVLNSDAERLAVKDIISREPAVLGSQNRDYLLTGYREAERYNYYSRVFKTIFDENFEEAGFGKWALTEPNDLSEKCGCVFIQDSLLADIGCNAYSGFICEKEIPAKKSSRPDQYLADSYSKSRVKKYTLTRTVLSVDYE